MKMIKKLFTSAVLIALSASAFALESRFNSATANTITDDASYLMNSTEWNKLNFDKTFVFTSIDSNASGNIAAAFKLKNNATLMTSWDGNLWSATNKYNNFAALYGTGKYSFGASFASGTTTVEIPIYGSSSADITEFGLTFGMNVTDKDDITAAFGYISSDDFGDDSIITLTGGYKRNLTKTSNASIIYTGIFFNDITTNTFVPAYHYEYNNKKVSYGFTATAPVTFASYYSTSETMFTPVINNGVSLNLSDSFSLNAGLSTTLPYIAKTEGMDATYGNFLNTFTFGFSINAGSAVKIDASSVFNLASGVSIDDILTTPFMLSVSMKF